MSASAYDQGQYLTSLYNWVTPTGELVIKREEKDTFYVIQREVDFDPHSVIQVIDAEWSHVPQSRLIMDSVSPLILRPERQLNEPIFVQEPEYEDSGVTGTVATLTPTVTPLSNDLNMQKKLFQLWSRFLEPMYILRKFQYDSSKPKLMVQPNITSNLTTRQQIWILAFETLLNYMPTLASVSIYTQLRTTVDIAQCQQGIQEVAQVMGIAGSDNLYTQLLASSEGTFWSPNSTTVFSSAAQIVANYMQSNPNLFTNRDQNLILWLLMPHPTSITQVDRVWHYVMFTLAYQVRNGRQPTNTEFETYWSGVVQSNDFEGKLPADVAMLQNTASSTLSEFNQAQSGGVGFGSDPVSNVRAGINAVTAVLQGFANALHINSDTLSTWIGVGYGAQFLNLGSAASFLGVVYGTYRLLEKMWGVHLEQEAMKKVIEQHRLFGSDALKARTVLGDVNFFTGLSDDPGYVMYWMMRVAKDMIGAPPTFAGMNIFQRMVDSIKESVSELPADVWAKIAGLWPQIDQLIANDNLTRELSFSTGELEDLHRKFSTTEDTPGVQPNSEPEPEPVQPAQPKQLSYTPVRQKYNHKIGKMNLQGREPDHVYRMGYTRPPQKRIHPAKWQSYDERRGKMYKEVNPYYHRQLKDK